MDAKQILNMCSYQEQRNLNVLFWMVRVCEGYLNVFCETSSWIYFNDLIFVPHTYTHSSGYGGSGNFTESHSYAASVTAAMCGPFSKKNKNKQFVGQSLFMLKYC